MSITSSTCEDDNPANEGREAGQAFCNCVKSHDKDYCLDKLKDNYSYQQYTSSEFINEFNDTNPCHAELTRVYLKSIDDGTDIIEYSLIIKP